QTRIDHHGKLTGEHREVLRFDFLSELAGLPLRRRFNLVLGRSDSRDHDLLAPERSHGRIHCLGSALATDGLSPAGSSSVSKGRHTCLPLKDSSVTETTISCAGSSWLHRPETGRGVVPGVRLRPAPATTPTPRLIMSCSSSFRDEAAMAVSSVINRFM